MLWQRLFSIALVVSLSMLVIGISFTLAMAGNATTSGNKDQTQSPRLVHALLCRLSDRNNSNMPPAQAKIIRNVVSAAALTTMKQEEEQGTEEQES